MRIQIACLLLGLLFAIELSEAKNGPQKGSDASKKTKKPSGTALTFQQKHINKDMTEDQCNEKMKAVNKKNQCKEKNTFILSEEGLVNDLCKDVNDNKHKESTDAFKIVNCIHDKTSKHPKCAYKGETSEEKITVTCKDKKPVHYGKSNENNS